MCAPPEEVQHSKLKDHLQAPTESDTNEFFKKLSNSNTKPAILSTVAECLLGYDR